MIYFILGFITALIICICGSTENDIAWHFMKDGDLPKGKDVVLIYWKSDDVNCVSVVEPYHVTEDTHIIAWKEIVLPELEENET